jgi:hypothetical protein
MEPRDSAEKSLGDVVSEVSEKASLLVREEIELAKAEISAKVKSIGKGAGVAIAAGIFLSGAAIMFLFWLSFFINDLFNWEADIWPGFAAVTVGLMLLAVIAGLLAKRWLSRGAPPTPDLAIEEAKRTREALEQAQEVRP